MFDFLMLKNFQSHKDTGLGFVPGVNVIVGSSDSGKTAIIRSLLWVIENRPVGTAHISHWAKTRSKSNKVVIQDGCEVILRLTDGSMISRFRSEDSNQYKLISAKNELVTFDAVKSEVPEDVLTALNISAVNIGRQMDVPFLVAETSGEVARFLNRVIHMDIIDDVLAKAESEKRRHTKLISEQQEAIKKTEEAMLFYQWIPTAEDLVQKLQTIQEDIGVIADQDQDIHSSLKMIQMYSDALPKVKDWDEVDSFIELLSGLQTRIEITLQTHQTIALEIQNLESITNSIPNLNFENITDITEKLNTLLLELGEMTVIRKTLTQEVGTQKELTDGLIRCDIEIDQIREQFPDVCPVCNQPISDEVKHEISGN
jgi:recombinational DNA repair ATPase RecF